MRKMATESIDLVYADPPFNTGRTQRGEGGSRLGDSSESEPLVYCDSWPTVLEYIAFLRERVVEIHRLLKPTGSILLHVDWRTSHHVRLLLDEVFGPEQFVNHLIWSYGLGGSSPRRFARKHDDILFYGRSASYWFEPPRVAATSVRMRGMQKKATDVLDIPSINNMACERTGYPTQKPLQLLSLLVGACCPVGGTVLDPFCGSGTTLHAARALGRSAIGLDSSAQAIRITRDRLARAQGAGSRAQGAGRRERGLGSRE